MEKTNDFDGFYLNNVKYIKCQAAEGAAITNRHNKHSYLLWKFGLKHKGDFEQHRDWIFADREEDSISQISQGDDNPTVVSPGRNTEISTKFGSAAGSVFQKLRICIVDIEDQRKPEFKKKIESNGGKAVLDLSKNKVDILLSSKALGINFKNALLWGIACIHPDWIEKSIQAAKLLPLQTYRVVDDSENFPPPPVKKSTPPTKHRVSRAVSMKQEFEVGGVKSNSKPVLSTQKASECNSLNWKTSNSSIIIDTYNVSTRL